MRSCDFSLAIAAEDGKLSEQTWILSLLAISLAHEGRMQEALDAVKRRRLSMRRLPPDLSRTFTG